MKRAINRSRPRVQRRRGQLVAPALLVLVALWLREVSALRVDVSLRRDGSTSAAHR